MIGPPTTVDEFVEMTLVNRTKMAANGVKNGSRFGFSRQESEDAIVLSNLMVDSGLSLFSLHDAVSQGNRDIIKKYEQNPSCAEIMNLLDEEGLAPLHISARHNDVKTTLALLELGAKVNVRGKDDITPLHIAVRYNCLETVELLVKRGADINSPTTESFTPLHMAAKRSYVKLVEVLLINGGTDVNARDNNDNTALHFACSSGKHDVVELFLRARANVLLLNSDKKTPLHCSTNLHGNIKVINLILLRAQEKHVAIQDYVNRKDIQGDNALHLAAGNGYEEAVQVLIENKVNINDINLARQTPLHLAAIGGHLKVVESLIAHKAVVRSVDKDGRTPLHSAAAYGHLDVVKILVRKGAKVNTVDDHDMTPFLCALENSKTACAEYLIKAKADIKVRAKNSKTCLHFAVEAGSDACLMMLLKNGAKEFMECGDKNESTPLHYAAMLQSCKVLNLLLDYTTSVAVKDHVMRTILHVAVEYMNLQCVQLLCLRTPMLINEIDDTGRTPLHIAATQNRRKIIQCLLQHGAHVLAKDDNHQTPVHYAARYGNNKVLMDMLRYNPALEMLDNQGLTALHLATKHAQNDTVKLLIDNGADILARDYDGLTCLDIAIENQDSLIATQIVRDIRGREILSVKGLDGYSRMKKLIEKLPDVAEVIMDMSIEESVLPKMHPDYSITYDFGLLDPGPDDDSTLQGNRFFAPNSMAKYRRERLLNHPLCQKLLHQKWSKFGRVFYAFHFITYFLFLISFTTFIVIQRDIEKLGNIKDVQNQSNNSSSTQTQPRVVPTHILTVKDYVCTYLFGFALFHILIELLQMIMQRLRYWKDLTKPISWVTYVTSIVYVVDYVPFISATLYVDPYTRWTCGIFAVFLGFVGLLFFLEKSSFMGIYITMFVDVFKTMLRVLGMFVLFIFGFGVVFHVLLKEQEAFETLWGHS